MIVKQNRCDALSLHLENTGESIRIPRHCLESLFYADKATLPLPMASTPPRRQNLCRVAFLGSNRVKEGFSFHNSIYPVMPQTWEPLLRIARPHYLLVESCLYDSEQAWPQLALQKSRHMAMMGQITETARRYGVPSVFWHTMGSEYLNYFSEVMPFFDIVACTDIRSLEVLHRQNIHARLLPLAFSPERFNPLNNFVLASAPSRLVFDGTASMLRFPSVRETLQELVDCDLLVVDTAMVSSDYTLQRFQAKCLASQALGCLGGDDAPALYRSATAYLSMDMHPEAPSQATWCRALEVAACRTPLLHIGSDLSNGFLDEGTAFWRAFPNVSTLKEAYLHLRDDMLTRERTGHHGWRVAHTRHTFAHRMDTIHDWLGIPHKAVAMPKASILTPSMRPECLDRALAQYEAQTWPNKEFVYVFNGSETGTQRLQELAQNRQDIHIRHIPFDYSTGMVMNAGLNAASGDFVFKFDDDDLYGAHYVADRMVYFREFDIVALGNTRSFMAFSGDEQCMIFNKVQPRQDCVSCSFGHVEYALSNFTGATVAYNRSFALNIGYQEQAYANADVSFLRKSVLCAPHAAIVNMDILNFCVLRGGHQGHTWAASKDELRNMSGEQLYLLQDIFA